MKKGRKVKFAEPLAEQRLFERVSSAPDNKVVKETKSKHPPALSDLTPPLSLVAQLDLAAKKLNAREPIKADEKADQTLKAPNSPKSTKSTKSNKSTKSAASVVRDVKSNLKKNTRKDA